MNQSISTTKPAKNPNDRGHHPSHSDISSLEGDALKRNGLPLYEEPPMSKPTAREAGVGTMRSREDILAAQAIRSPRTGTCKVEGMARSISGQK